MNKYFFYRIILSALLFIGLYSPAQDVKIHPSVDSVFAPMQDEQERGKDKNQKFSKIQSQDKLPVVDRKIDEGDLNAIKQDKAFWYADYKPKKRAERKEGKNVVDIFLSSQWFKILLFIILGIAVLWFIMAGDFKLFRKKSKFIKSKISDEAGKNIFETDFETHISNAIAANDYPLAIRLHYLQTLKELSNKKIIHYSPDHTNADFVNQLSNSSYYKDFFFLTRSFEYSWYGKFTVSKPAFEKIQDNFISFNNKIPS